jgi:hypothetical protein
MLTNKIFLKANKTTFESDLKSSTFLGRLFFLSSSFSIRIIQSISSMWPSPIPRVANFWPSRPTSSLLFPLLLFFLETHTTSSHCLLLLATDHHLHHHTTPPSLRSTLQIFLTPPPLCSGRFPILPRSLEPKKFSS